MKDWLNFHGFKRILKKIEKRPIYYRTALEAFQKQTIL